MRHSSSSKGYVVGGEGILVTGLASVGRAFFFNKHFLHFTLVVAQSREKQIAMHSAC